MKDLLQVATRGGSGSAARTLGGGLAGITRRVKRSGLALAAVLFLAYLGWDMLSGMSVTPASRGSRSFEPIPTGSPTSTPLSDVDHSTQADRVAYSIDLSDIAGLSPTTVPGSAVELWVTWDRPLTRSPKLQRVVRNAVLERVNPPVTPDGPTVATFLVSRNEIDGLLWADSYGALSATIPLP